MRLSDIMSRMDLALFPTIALLIFLAVFLIVAWRALRSRREEFDRYARLPLNDEITARTAAEQSPRSRNS